MITSDERAELDREWGTKTYVFGYDEELDEQKPYTLQAVGARQISTHPTLASAIHSARVRTPAPLAATPDPDETRDRHGFR